MAMILSPSSHSPNDDDHDIPTATLALPAIPAASASRRLPPPCWSPDETVALIDAYKDKWYSLRRGHLRANHWQEVAEDVGSRCPVIPPKTAVQCRHKMEKLRKRYRAEIQRAEARGGVRRFSSSWAHFQNMYTMEKGHNNPSPPSSDDEDEDDHNNSIKRINNLYNNNNNQKHIFGNQAPIDIGATPGFRIKFPGGVTAAKIYSKFDEMGGQNTNSPNPRFTNSAANGYASAPNKVFRDGFQGRSETGKSVHNISKKKKVDDGIGDVVAAIQALGEGFMRIEEAKMDMARQIEQIRMEMELKKTEMILDSQQRIVQEFAQAISDRRIIKNAKRMHPDS